MYSKKLILFGAGLCAKRALKYFGDEQVYCFCDNSKYNTVVFNKKVISFEELKKIHNDYTVIVTVSNPNYLEQILSQLKSCHINYYIFSELFQSENSTNITNMFSSVYKTNMWGGDDEFFYSGSGSHTSEIISPYIEYLSSFISLNNIKSICDIGCGDFYIMNKVLSRLPSIHYTGLDVVKELINHNAQHFANRNISFVHMDASNPQEILPPADLLIIRQVLQHLNNDRISTILAKSRNYKYVLITEHLYKGNDFIPNIDMTMGADIRLCNKSGIYIEHKPFSLKHVVHVLEIPEANGIIRTSLIVN